MKLEKKFGDILVKDSCGNCGIVEFIYKGCVICYYEVRDVDGEPFPELQEVHDRLTSMNLNRDDFWEALEFGRKFADFLNELNRRERDESKIRV